MKYLDRMSLKELVSYRENLSETIMKVNDTPGILASDEDYDALDAIDREIEKKVIEDELEDQLRYK